MRTVCFDWTDGRMDGRRDGGTWPMFVRTWLQCAVAPGWSPGFIITSSRRSPRLSFPIIISVCLFDGDEERWLHGDSSAPDSCRVHPELFPATAIRPHRSHCATAASSPRFFDFVLHRSISRGQCCPPLADGCQLVQVRLEKTSHPAAWLLAVECSPQGPKPNLVGSLGFPAKCLFSFYFAFLFCTCRC